MPARKDQGNLDSGVDVIGEGTFGCAHKPSMQCRDKKNRNINEISKLMTSANAAKELNEFALIDAADKGKQFYLGKPRKCEVDRILSNIRFIRKCPSGKFDPTRMDDYSLLVMKYGGQDLELFGEEVMTWTKTKEHVDAIELFWLEVIRLFYGLKVLHDNNVLHHDIKQQNIVYNQATNRVNLIDFGFMEKKSARISAAKRSESWLGNKHHWSFPLEAVYWNKIDYTNACMRGKSERAYNAFADSVADNCGYFFISCTPVNFNNLERDKTVKKITYGAFKNVLEFEPTDEAYDRFVEKSIDSVDTYGLGIALMFLLHRSKHLLSTDFYKKLGEIVGMDMLHPRVFLRSTPEQLLAQYEDLLTNSGLLEKHNKHIENHLIANKVSREMKVAEAIADSSFIPVVVTKNADIEIVRDCPAGKEFNPLTKRCVKVCATGKVRNPAFRCVKDKSVNVCPVGKELNPRTRRCVKGCGVGLIRNSAFKCVRDKTRKNRITISPIAVKQPSSVSMLLNIPAMTRSNSRSNSRSNKWATGISDNWSKSK